MAKTSIEWTSHVWNPIRGCSRVSHGCERCYAERMAARFSDPGDHFHGFAIRTGSGPRWTGKVELIEEKLLEPLRWRKPRLTFVNSMSDLFHEDLPDEAIDRVFAVMALCSRQTFQILTKRPNRMLKWASRAYLSGDVQVWANELRDVRRLPFAAALHHHPEEVLKMSEEEMLAVSDVDRWPLPNVWLGVSVEDQKTADERIPLLLNTPAAIRFVSYEPALGPLNITPYLPGDCGCGAPYPPPQVHGSLCPARIARNGTRYALDWLIAGGESGPGARPSHPDWYRTARDQCQAAGVAFFLKQITGPQDFAPKTKPGAKIPFERWPADLQVREMPSR